MKFENSIKHKNYSNKLKAFLKRNVLSCFLKMARLLLVFVVNGSEFHKNRCSKSKGPIPKRRAVDFWDTKGILQTNKEHN